MSLDVNLRWPQPEVLAHSYEGEPVDDELIYQANYTHNVINMAEAAGLYDCVWRPEENGITTAGQLIEPLRAGIERMAADPGRFRAMDLPNGWGRYDSFLPWLRRYLGACTENPDALVAVSR